MDRQTDKQTDRQRWMNGQLGRLIGQQTDNCKRWFTDKHTENVLTSIILKSRSNLGK